MQKSYILISAIVVGGGACGKYEPKPVSGFSPSVQKIFSENCVTCHAGGNAEAGLGFIDKPSQLIKNQYVIPGASASSVLYNKVGSTPPFGARMPFGGPYLKDSQVADIAAWIDSLGSYYVTIVGSGFESIEPSEGKRVPEGESLAVTVTPNAGFEVVREVGGDCPSGSWVADTYTTGPIYGDCSLQFTANGFYTVTPGGSDRLTISPAAPQKVASGGNATFEVKPLDSGEMSRDVGGTCATGFWAGDTYTTGSIDADCSVTFALVGELIVTASSADANTILIAPASRIVTSGASAQFVLTPGLYTLEKDQVAGTCPVGAWVGNTYTTGTITASCSVIFKATHECGTADDTVTFADINDIFSSGGCTGCHFDGSSYPDLPPEAIYASSEEGDVSEDRLMAFDDDHANQADNPRLIDFGFPKNSKIFIKITGDFGDVGGDRMPLGGQPISAANQSRVCNWIKYTAYVPPF